MRVLPINNNYMQYKTSNAVHQKRTAQAVSAPTFKALFGKPSSQDLFDYGVQALDDTSMLIVTKDREKAEFSLGSYKDKIDIPVMKTYILDITKDLDKAWYESSDSDVAIFKKGEDYYAMVLGFCAAVYIREPRKEASKDDIVSAGNVKKLTNGMVLELKGWSAVGEREKRFVYFNKPKLVDKTRAEKYLEVRTYMDSAEKIKAHNNAAIMSMIKPKTQKAKKSTKKEFTFADVGGLDNIIADLRKYVIRPLKYPQVFENIRLNKGILLYGPPRCGKTLIGQALANEAGIKFAYRNANEFKTAKVGESEASVRNAFEQMMAEPCILFIDEIDGIAKERDGSSNARYDDSLVNQLLGSMSDLEKSDTMSFVIGATNKRELMDKAFLASGRFGLQLEVPMPNEEALGQIYDIHSKKQRFADDVQKPEIVKMMFENSFNGSDVAEMISVGFFNALERLGMNAKMDLGTFTRSDLEKIKVAKEDLVLAIKNISKQKIKG